MDIQQLPLLQFVLMNRPAETCVRGTLRSVAKVVQMASCCS